MFNYRLSWVCHILLRYSFSIRALFKYHYQTLNHFIRNQYLSHIKKFYISFIFANRSHEKTTKLKLNPYKQIHLKIFKLTKNKLGNDVFLYIYIYIIL